MTERIATNDIKIARTLADAIVDTVREPLVVLDGNLRVVAASRSFYQAFGVAPDNTQGRLFFELAEGQWDIPALRKLLDEVIPRHRTIEAYEIEHEFASMGRRTLLLNARQVFDEAHPNSALLLAIEDVTQRRAVEREKDELLREKEMLLEEMRHRVANSLQIIASILLLKARTVQSEETRRHLQDAHQRVMSVATVQEQLRGTGHGDRIEIGPYLTKLCDNLAKSMIGADRSVAVVVEAGAGAAVSGHAVSIGLIVTELLINAVKHAFPADRSGEIRVRYDAAGSEWHLSVSDDGIGRVSRVGQPASTRLGTSIVEALAHQLDARVEISSGPHGTIVSVIHGASLQGAQMAPLTLGTGVHLGNVHLSASAKSRAARNAGRLAAFSDAADVNSARNCNCASSAQRRLIMIRKLMVSSAVLALISAGALTAAQAEDNPAKPAIAQLDAATAAQPATTELVASNAVLTPDRPTLLSVFMGKSVYSSEDPQSDNIGDINDLIVSEDGKITHAVVGVGGFLGIGEKDVAVPFDELEVVEKDGDIRLIYAATRQQLEAAPALDRTAYNRLQHPADQQAATIENPQPAAGVTATEQPSAETKPAMAGDVTFLSLDKDQILATSIIGQGVYGPDDKSIGEVSDLVLQEDGKTRAALIDVGGFLGIGEKTVAIPFEEIKVAKGTDQGSEPKLVVAMTSDQLEKLPEVRTDTAAVEQPAATSTAPAQDKQASPATTADEQCTAAWVAADANKNGVLDAKESARYLAALRVADKPLANDTTLTEPIFIENCNAGYFDTVSAEAGAPFEGANSFTEGQAQDRILAAGFTNVSALTKDDKGIWRGTAEAQGKKVNVAVDYKGNVITANM